MVVVMAKRMKIVRVVSMHLQGATSKSAAKEAIPYRGNQYIKTKKIKDYRDQSKNEFQVWHIHYNKFSID